MNIETFTVKDIINRVVDGLNRFMENGISLGDLNYTPAVLKVKHKPPREQIDYLCKKITFAITDLPGNENHLSLCSLEVLDEIDGRYGFNLHVTYAGEIFYLREGEDVVFRAKNKIIGDYQQSDTDNLINVFRKLEAKG